MPVMVLPILATGGSSDRDEPEITRAECEQSEEQATHPPPILDGVADGPCGLPWTTLMYVIVWSPGGVHRANWIAVAIGFLLDVLSYTGRFSQRWYQQRTASA
jgi:hypothetical protein